MTALKSVHLDTCPRAEVACVVLSVVFRHILSKFCVSPAGSDKDFVSVFYTPAAKRVFNKPDRRPTHITGRRVSAVHQGGVGAPNELATFRVHDAVVDFVERSV